MSAPGVQIIQRDSPPARTAPTDTGVWFLAGITERGPTTPTLVTSLAKYAATFGDRVSYGIVYDALDVFFKEGGGSAYVARVVGPSPVAATVTLVDGAGSPVNALVVTANSYGDWGNSLNIAVLAGDNGGEFKLQVSHDVDGILETSPSLVDQAAAFAWAANSSWITLAASTSSADPAVVAARSLVGGTDDHGSITDTHWKAALTRCTRDLGPGQVSMPGRTTTQANTDTLDHAATHNRIAILDGADTATIATLKTAAAAQTANAANGGLFAPWVKVPGNTATANLPRTVPPSAVVAGIIGRNDGAGISPNKPSAGKLLGRSRYAIGLTQPAWTDTDGGERDQLNEAGVNVIRQLYGVTTVYGYRTLADSVTDPNHVGLNNVRLDMRITAECEVILEDYVFDEIDGRGFLFSKVGGRLGGVLNAWWVAGSLYGDTSEEAYSVDLGPDVNTPETIVARQLRAAVGIKRSEMAEQVILELVTVGIAESV